MEAKREFIYEREKRRIQGLDNIKDVKEVAYKFLRLYLAQGDLVDGMIKRGWLPEETATGMD